MRPGQARQQSIVLLPEVYDMQWMKHNLASNDSKKSMNNSHGFSLMLVSTINVLERVHIREFPVYDPFMTVIFHFYELQFISQSIQTQTLYISGGYMHSFFL